ncbi:hypothetical protein R3W88_026508 [Solanum pinnatisectum]|uniref:Uncharacterized protein n=1 Tax=Solanum pinnatisectum TaxID=50273 RepID=A0AAV9LDK9_9SOLN|nr:hypothetical protein R3W88_026508 [Solanum pinnatisectum]
MLHGYLQIHADIHHNLKDTQTFERDSLAWPFCHSYISTMEIYAAPGNLENQARLSLSKVWRLEGYDEYQHEFTCTCGTWVHMRPRVFIMAFLGIMTFPMRFHSVDINILPMVMSIFNNPQRYSLVPMIFAEELRSLTTYTRGHNFFRGCNMLLQMLARKHFYRRIRGFVDNKWIDWVRESMLSHIVPGSIDYLIQVVEEEDLEEDPKEDPEEDPKKDPEEELEEDLEEDPEEDPKEEVGVIDMSPEHDPEEDPHRGF